MMDDKDRSSGENVPASHPEGQSGDARAPKLLDLLRDSLRARHYSRRTEATYAQWVRRFIYFHRFATPKRWESLKSTLF
jgi:hypothetical protein